MTDLHNIDRNLKSFISLATTRTMTDTIESTRELILSNLNARVGSGSWLGLDYISRLPTVKSILSTLMGLDYNSRLPTTITMTDTIHKIDRALTLIKGDIYTIESTLMGLDFNSRLPKPNIEEEAWWLERLRDTRQDLSQHLSQVRRLVEETGPHTTEFTQQFQCMEALITSYYLVESV